MPSVLSLSTPQLAALTSSPMVLLSDFVRTGNYDALAGVILAVTGCEAIFANLGQFTPNSIRIGFMFVYTSLVFQYLGQGAR